MQINLQKTADAPSPSESTPGIIAPGPCIALGALVLGLILDQIFPIDTTVGLDRLLRTILVVMLGAAGGWFVWQANLTFRQAGTAVMPWKPARTLATADIYAHTRNPMYQGFVLMALALAVLMRSGWTMLLIVPASVLIHYGVVRPEERYLLEKFGQSYRAYQKQAPRYGLPFASTTRSAWVIATLVAILLGAFAWAIQPKPMAWTIDPHRIREQHGYFGWVVPRPTLAPLTTIPADHGADPRRSELQLFEDGRPLGPAHAFTPDDQSIHSAGEYAHWRLTVYFAASDGSDPRTNGRVYQARAAVRPDPRVAGTTGVLLLTSTVLVLVLMLRRAARQAKE